MTAWRSEQCLNEAVKYWMVIKAVPESVALKASHSLLQVTAAVTDLSNRRCAAIQGAAIQGAAIQRCCNTKVLQYKGAAMPQYKGAAMHIDRSDAMVHSMVHRTNAAVTDSSPMVHHTDLCESDDPMDLRPLELRDCCSELKLWRRGNRAVERTPK